MSSVKTVSKGHDPFFLWSFCFPCEFVFYFSWVKTLLLHTWNKAWFFELEWAFFPHFMACFHHCLKNTRGRRRIKVLNCDIEGKIRVWVRQLVRCFTKGCFISLCGYHGHSRESKCAFRNLLISLFLLRHGMVSVISRFGAAIQLWGVVIEYI